MRGADGVKIAVLRKDRASLSLIWAAAHAQRYALKNQYREIRYGEAQLEHSNCGELVGGVNFT
jgi:hypothetical protein